MGRAEEKEMLPKNKKWEIDVTKLPYAEGSDPLDLDEEYVMNSRGEVLFFHNILWARGCNEKEDTVLYRKEDAAEDSPLEEMSLDKWHEWVGDEGCVYLVRRK